MKWELFGGADCSDWLLAGISFISRLSWLKFRVVCKLVVPSLTGDQLDVERIDQICREASLDEAHSRCIIATISHIVHSSVRHTVSEDQLTSELTQLGLPREHVAVLSQQLQLSRDQLRSTQLLSLPRRTARLEVECWPVHLVNPRGEHGGGSSGFEVESAVQMLISDRSSSRVVQLTRDTAQLLRNELVKARAVMNEALDMDKTNETVLD